MRRRDFIALPPALCFLPRPNLAQLPEGQEPIPEPHFPSRLYLFVWRNWELANAELHSTAKVEFLESLYAAGAREIVEIIRALPDSVNKPLLVGHNPGFEECAALLARDSRDPAAHFRFDSIQEKVPTAALAVLDFNIAHWKELAPHTGTLADFIRPKDLED